MHILPSSGKHSACVHKRVVLIFYFILIRVPVFYSILPCILFIYLFILHLFVCNRPDWHPSFEVFRNYITSCAPFGETCSFFIIPRQLTCFYIHTCR